MHKKNLRVINFLILPNSVTSIVEEKFFFRSSISKSLLAGRMFNMLALDPLFPSFVCKYLSIQWV